MNEDARSAGAEIGDGAPGSFRRFAAVPGQQKWE